MFRTVPLSIITSIFTVHTAMAYVSKPFMTYTIAMRTVKNS